MLCSFINFIYLFYSILFYFSIYCSSGILKQPVRKTNDILEKVRTICKCLTCHENTLHFGRGKNDLNSLLLFVPQKPTFVMLEVSFRVVEEGKLFFTFLVIFIMVEVRLPRRCLACDAIEQNPPQVSFEVDIIEGIYPDLSLCINHSRKH